MPEVRTPPPADPSRYHHEQGARHHLDRMYKYTREMRDGFGSGEVPSMEHALQVSADLVRYIAHLAALKELDVLAARAPRKRAPRAA